jgi:hypothetical protein
MPALDLRERCLSAIESILAATVPDSFKTFQRQPDWNNNVLPGPLPALAMYDGSETGDPLELPDIDHVRMAVSFEVYGSGDDAKTCSIELNRLRALVKSALGADPTLDGLVVRMNYIGCDEAESIDLREGPSDGRMRLNFEVYRLEGSFDPYGPSEA